MFLECFYRVNAAGRSENTPAPDPGREIFLVKFKNTDQYFFYHRRSISPLQIRNGYLSGIPKNDMIIPDDFKGFFPHRRADQPFHAVSHDAVSVFFADRYPDPRFFCRRIQNHQRSRKSLFPFFEKTVEIAFSF